MRTRLVVMGIVVGLNGHANAAQSDFSMRNRTEVRAHDYLYRQQGLRKDPIFDEYRTIDLGFNLGVGSDCGRIDFKNTLQASLKNILDSRYFGDMGRDIMAASPMLATCYFSPTWCAILKHSQVNANFMAQMRLDQCALTDKFVDSRVSDFYEERQGCVHREIEKNGGNMEAAMQACNRGQWDTNLANWSGSKFGDKSSTNKLIESSARWAGLDSAQGKKAISLVQALVGDTVVTKGRLAIEYGGKPAALTPRTHLAALEEEIHSKLCDGLLTRIESAQGRRIDTLVRERDLEDIGLINGQLALDRQTIRGLAAMPARTRALYCRKLSNSVALSKFSDEMNRSLDVLMVASQNPNLPDRRRQEIMEKRQILKDSIDATLALSRERNAPLNQVLMQINDEGRRYQAEATEERLSNDGSRLDERTMRARFFDCADGVLCD